ncbi:MAG: bifunctional nuclease family protein [Nitrospiraceae bacterium]
MSTATPERPGADALIPVHVHGVVRDENTETHIVVLRDEQGQDVLPIWVGLAEGNAIRLAQEGIVTPRPMTHDLIRNVATHLGVQISRVVISDVKKTTYYATVYLTSKGVDRTLDARPSDAIALAIRAACPMFVTKDVLDRRVNINAEAWLNRAAVQKADSQEV